MTNDLTHCYLLHIADGLVIQELTEDWIEDGEETFPHDPTSWRASGTSSPKLWQPSLIHAMFTRQTLPGIPHEGAQCSDAQN